MKVVYGIVLTMELLISLTVHQAMMLKSYVEVNAPALYYDYVTFIFRCFSSIRLMLHW